MNDILDDLKSAAARKWHGDPACQQAGLFARAAAEIEMLRSVLRECERELSRWSPGYMAPGLVDRVRAALKEKP